MNLFHILDGQTALVLAVLSGTVMPFLSALATKAPTALTGTLTALLAAAAGFLGEWAAHPNSYDWKTGVSTALGAWVVALVMHKGVLSDTLLQDSLHARGPQFGPPAHPARRTPRKAA